MHDEVIRQMKHITNGAYTIHHATQFICKLATKQLTKQPLDLPA